LSVQQKSNVNATDPSKEYGTEKDITNCAFYLKTGSCKYADRCGKRHPYPSSSTTILFKNMYDGLGLTEVLDEDADEDLQYDEAEIEKHYKEFYTDTLGEFQNIGQVVQFKVCRNYASHLRGNVYVQYTDEVSAQKAFNAFRGRYYAAKQLTPEFVPITNWKSAVCGTYDKRRCPRGKECNFLHVFKNPDGQFDITQNEGRENYRDKDRNRGYGNRGDRNRGDRDRERDNYRENDRDRERGRGREGNGREGNERDEYGRDRHYSHRYKDDQRDRDEDYDRERDHHSRSRDHREDRHRHREHGRGDRERHRSKRSRSKSPHTLPQDASTESVEDELKKQRTA